MTAALACAGVAGALSLVVVRVLERYAAAFRLVDLPNERSSHTLPRPRGGGLGIVAGTMAALVVGRGAGVDVDPATQAVIGAALAVAVVGLVDDLRNLTVLPRLGAQVLVSIMLVALVGGFDRLPLPPPLDLPLGGAGPAVAVLWLVAVVNFFNFMDGADGLAGGQAVISLGLLAWAFWPAPLALVALATAAAAAGFLLRNWSPARIFLGDVGSAWLGYLLAALPLAAPENARAAAVGLVGVSLALFLIDPTVTLVRRTLRGRPIGQAHRDHVYQQLVGPRVSHAPGVTLLLGLALVLAGAAAFAYRHAGWRWWAIGVGIVIFLVEWRVARRLVVTHQPPSA